MIEKIVIDDEEIVVVPEMIVRGSLDCQTCGITCDEAVRVRGTIYWDCPHGHQSSVVLYGE